MQRGHVNGHLKVNYTKYGIKTKPINSKSKNGTVNFKARSTSSKFQSIEDDDLDLAPYVVRKDRLIQELETSLAEMDGQLESASKLEEQKTAVEDQRTLLLKEIETAVCDIQAHVLNAREMEIEKKAIENECDSLKLQVKHLRNLLDDKKTAPNDKHWNYVDLTNSEDTMRASLAHANARNQALEKELTKLKLANERLLLKETSSKGSVEFEQLQRDYLDLQKLLQVAENSEDNIAHELATCHQSMAKMKSEYEQLEKSKVILEKERDNLFLQKTEIQVELKKFKAVEDERDTLALEKTELEMEVRKIRDDSLNSNVIDKDLSSRWKKEKEALLRKLVKYEEHHEKLEQENLSYKQLVEQLRNDLKTARETSSPTEAKADRVEKSNFADQRLKAATIKFNKENSELRVSLEKAEKEIEDLKSRLAKENEGSCKEDQSQHLRPAFEKLNKENSELQVKLEMTEKELSAIKICLDEERESKKSEETPGKKVEKTKKKGLKLKDSKKTKKDKKEQSVDDSEGIKDELECLKKEKLDLTSECQALSETVTKIAGEKRTLDKEIQEHRIEKEQLEVKVTELESTLKELGIIKKEKEALEMKNHETELLLAQVSAELQKTVESKSSLNDKFEKVTGEKNMLVSEQKEFQESLLALKQEMEIVRKDVSNKSIEIRLLRKKHEEEKKKLIGMKDGGDKEITRIKTELKDISSKVMKTTDEDIEHDGNDVISTVEKLHKEIEELGLKNAQLELSNQELDTKLQEINKQVEELKKESAKARDMAMEKAVELSRTKRSLERKVEKLNKENVEYRKKLGVATPAMSITPRISPETVQVQKIEVVESQPPLFQSPPVSEPPTPLEPSPPLQPPLPSHHTPQAPPRQRTPQPVRAAEARYEGSSKPGDPIVRAGPPDYLNRGPQEHYREGSRTRSGPVTRPSGADSRPPERSPPPYPLAKRKSLDNGLAQDRDRGSRRDLLAYPPRERRTSETRSRAPSASITTGSREEEARFGSSIVKERRQSDGGYSYHKRSTGESERYRHENRPSDQMSAFRVVNHRRKVVHEDYV